MSKSAAAEIGSGDKLPPVAVAVKVMRPGVREAMEFGVTSLPVRIEKRSCSTKAASSTIRQLSFQCLFRSCDLFADLRMMLLIASILQYLPSFGFVAVKKR